MGSRTSLPAPTSPLLSSDDHSPDQGLVVQVPDGDVPVTAAGEADFGVGGDGQCVAGGGRGGELRLDTWRRRGQVPDGQRAGLTAHNQGAAIREELTGADVVVPVLETERETVNIWASDSYGDNSRYRETHKCIAKYCYTVGARNTAISLHPQ